MKFELFLFGITGFLLFNMYYDGYYSKMLLTYKKYYNMAFIALCALCFYLLVKRNPANTRELLLYTHGAMKYLPIDKSSIEMISPIFDVTTKSTSFLPTKWQEQEQEQTQWQGQPKWSRPVKRAVSETKKKYVASMQGWKCGQCGNTLTHTFEIDHKIRLENGGGNEVDNLIALCRECHGQKTAMENM